MNILSFEAPGVIAASYGACNLVLQAILLSQQENATALDYVKKLGISAAITTGYTVALNAFYKLKYKFVKILIWLFMASYVGVILIAICYTLYGNRKSYFSALNHEREILLHTLPERHVYGEAFYGENSAIDWDMYHQKIDAYLQTAFPDK